MRLSHHHHHHQVDYKYLPKVGCFYWQYDFIIVFSLYSDNLLTF